MTTHVKITNISTSNSPHNVLVQSPINRFILKPGEDITAYTWDTNAITITELPLTPVQRPII